MKPKHDLLTLFDLSPQQILRLLARASFLKKARKKGKNPQTLRGKTLAMIFEKPSTRTKVSFDIAMYELGGHTVSLETGSSQLGRGETYQDTGRVLSGYAHGIVIRSYHQKGLEELAEGASIPVINGLSDFCHPCQILADLLTIQEVRGKKLNLNICYIGDGNNMANTWIMAAILLKFPLKIATPIGYEPSEEVLKMIDSRHPHPIVITHDPVEAVEDADVINTDTWFSMGQETSKEKEAAFSPFQVNSSLLKHARKEAIVLHCLPAHREEEITNEVLDGPQSRIWQEAENRLHIQKAILEMLLK